MTHDLILCFFFSNAQDLAQDCAHGSLDDLLLHDLLETANINDKCLEEARSAFNQNYGTKLFSISGPLVENVQNAFDCHHVIKIRHVDVIEPFLRTFGKDIEALEVLFGYFEASEGKEIMKYINEVFSDSTTLKWLSLQSCKGSGLDELKRTFPSVLTVWFSTIFNIEIPLDALKLSYVFASANTLRLDDIKPSEWEIIGENFRHLTTLEVNFWKFISLEELEMILNFLNDNDKISTLKTNECRLLYLKDTYEVLSKLKHLILTDFPAGYAEHSNSFKPIHFKQLERLTITLIADRRLLYGIHFDQIHEFDLFVEYKFNDEWIEFIDKQINQNLSSLMLEAQGLNNKQILTIVGRKPYLKTAKFFSNSNITADTIIEVIKDSKHLSELELYVAMIEAEVKKLKNKINNNWNIELYRFSVANRVSVMLQRKENVVEVESNMNPNNNGSSSLAMYSMQFLVMSLIYLLSKFF